MSNENDLGKKKNPKDKVVITVRISSELNEVLNQAQGKLGLSKADLIRNYLEMASFMLVRRGSLQSMDRRNLMIFKREIFTDYVKKLTEIDQVKLAEYLARFIDDIARLGKNEDIEYKLELCKNLGFFDKITDSENYVLFSHEFGPKKFVEAFAWRLFRQENYKFLESEMEKNKTLTRQYNKEVVCKTERSSINYAFEFARVPEKA